MKRLSHHISLAALLLMTSALTSCSKRSVSPEDAQPRLLVGHWVLTQTDGGLTGKVTPADPDQREEIIFDANNKATVLHNGAVTGRTSYSLFQASSYVNRRSQTFIAYGARTGTEKQFIEKLSGTQLVLVEDYADGRGYYYSRH